MSDSLWWQEFPGAVTVCDRQGIILDMNEESARVFVNDGGRDLIGRNVLDCHPEPARTQLQKMLESGEANVYTIEKHGVKKLIYQAPWYADGRYAGLVELSIPIPFELPHFIRS